MENECEHCGHSMQMTVRMLIHALMEECTDLDAPITVSVENGGITLVFDVTGLTDVGDDEQSLVCLFAESSGAWNSETGKDVETGVIMIDGKSE